MGILEERPYSLRALIYVLLVSTIITNLMNVTSVGSLAFTFVMLIIYGVVHDEVNNMRLTLYLTKYEYKVLKEHIHEAEQVRDDTYTITTFSEGCVCNIKQAGVKYLENTSNLKIDEHSADIFVNNEHLIEHEVKIGDTVKLRHHFIIKLIRRPIIGNTYQVYCSTTKSR